MEVSFQIADDIATCGAAADVLRNALDAIAAGRLHGWKELRTDSTLLGSGV